MIGRFSEPEPHDEDNDNGDEFDRCITPHLALQSRPLATLSATASRHSVFLHSNKNDDVPTPPEMLSALQNLFHFDYDPCPLYGLENEAVPDGLALDVAWGRRNFINPPYSNIKPWICRAIASETLCVMLLPARLHSLYWRNFVWPNAKTIYLLCEGVQFPGYERPFPCPMTIVVFFPHDYVHEPTLQDNGGGTGKKDRRAKKDMFRDDTLQTQACHAKPAYVAPTIERLNHIAVVTVHLHRPSQQ